MISPIKGNLRWYANVDGKNFGPYERSDIERMIQNRQLLATDYLCTVGGAEWIEGRNDRTFGRLFSNPVNVTAMRSDSPADVFAGGIKIYRVKSSTQWRIGIVCFVFGLTGLLPVKHILGWFSGGPRPENGEFIAVGVLLLLPAGIVFVTNALRGLPKLTVTSKGLKFEMASGPDRQVGIALVPSRSSFIPSGSGACARRPRKSSETERARRAPLPFLINSPRQLTQSLPN